MFTVGDFVGNKHWIMEIVYIDVRFSINYYKVKAYNRFQETENEAWLTEKMLLKYNCLLPEEAAIQLLLGYTDE